MWVFSSILETSAEDPEGIFGDLARESLGPVETDRQLRWDSVNTTSEMLPPGD